MGDARRKQYNRTQFLAAHPDCCYCGDRATTTDHCPPRSFFFNRQWPEAFEFPCCKPCNEQGRLDEQLLAVLTRISLKPRTPAAYDEWKRLVDGFRNNQPNVFKEWIPAAGATSKREFRSRFGPDGDKLRLAGYGAISLGPLTRNAMQRFLTKLGQALYYRHCGEILEGEIHTFYIDIFSEKLRSGGWDQILKFAPELAIPMRAGKSLADQFVYNFNCNPQVGALLAVVQFSEQMIFQIMVLRQSAANELAQRASENAEFLETSATKIVLYKPHAKNGLIAD